MLDSHTEIERKFLVSATRPELKQYDNLKMANVNVFYLEGCTYEQIGLPGLSEGVVDPDVVEVRVRASTHMEETTYTLTAKSVPLANKESPQSRAEVTIPLVPSTFETLVNRFAVGTIKKTRFEFMYDRKRFELDVFTDRTMMMLEVELKSPFELVSLPPAVILSKEVTYDAGFYGRNLAHPCTPTANTEPVPQ